MHARVPRLTPKVSWVQQGGLVCLSTPPSDKRGQGRHGGGGSSGSWKVGELHVWIQYILKDTLACSGLHQSVFATLVGYDIEDQKSSRRHTELLLGSCLGHAYVSSAKSQLL